MLDRLEAAMGDELQADADLHVQRLELVLLRLELVGLYAVHIG